MFLPPGFGQRQEAYNQIPQRRQRQNGRVWARRGREVGTGHRDVTVLIWGDFDLGMTHVSRQTGQPGKLERSSEKGMAGVGNGDLPLAFLLDERGITLGGFCPCPWVQ